MCQFHKRTVHRSSQPNTRPNSHLSRPRCRVWRRRILTSKQRHSRLRRTKVEEKLNPTTILQGRIKREHRRNLHHRTKQGRLIKKDHITILLHKKMVKKLTPPKNQQVQKIRNPPKKKRLLRKLILRPVMKNRKTNRMTRSRQTKRKTKFELFHSEGIWVGTHS